MMRNNSASGRFAVTLSEFVLVLLLSNVALQVQIAKWKAGWNILYDGLSSPIGTGCVPELHSHHATYEK